MFGNLKRILYGWRKRDYSDIDPDAIFMDSKNLPQFDTYQFEGRLEKSISQKSFSFTIATSFLVMLIFLFKIGSLQIVYGDEYRERSENNKLKQILLVAPRGIVYSRDGEKLAWNHLGGGENEEVGIAEDNFPERKYLETQGFGVLLGFIKYPAKDKAGFYYEEEYTAKDGIELYLNEMLAGRNGLKFIETDVSGEPVSQSIIKPGEKGQDATLSIDSRIQGKLFENIKKLAEKVDFKGGSGVIMDVESGELLAMTSYPEYSSQIMTDGKDENKISDYFQDPNNPFLNRAISGLYTPGSIVKPFMAFAALEENIISPEKEIVSTGQLVIPNRYNPDQPTIFKDWKAHGAVDMRRAIAVSSDVYFYQIGGGFENQKGLGIENIKKYLEKFRFTKKTGFDNTKEVVGIIPNPEWKKEVFGGDVWRVGDTYNTSIGQYGMQITPIQAVVATAALANGGKILSPSITFSSTSTVVSADVIEGDFESFEIPREGMRKAVTEGTAGGLNVPYVQVAGKTGTAELGARKQFVNSWVIGFFPYEKPKYAFVVVMERGPVTNLTGATYVMRQTLDWMHINTQEYFENK